MKNRRFGLSVRAGGKTLKSKRSTLHGTYLRLIDSCITQRKAQGPCRTCNESKEEEEEDIQTDDWRRTHQESLRSRVGGEACVGGAAVERIRHKSDSQG